MSKLRTAILLLSVAVVVILPLAMRPKRPPAVVGADRLIIITPHNEQIRSEFAPAFEAWHERVYGSRVDVVFNVPGGTSEIRKMLQAQFESALRNGRPVGGNADLVFGGGSYEHEQLKQGVSITVDGAVRSSPISAPVEFSPAELEGIYGENRVGDINLYDPDHHWFGTALSGFGIVYNRDLLAELGVDEPRSWTALADPRLRGLVALVNPGQSGSVTTALDAILQRRGWSEGWRILRRAGANSRYFSGSSLKPPIDVSRGNAAMGVSIDFYGRFQSQAIHAATGHDRVGYVDPRGETVIDPDPISMLRNAPHPETARRFIEFCLSESGQSLWQFAVDDPVDDDLGPRRYELRRMPVVRSMYATRFDRFVDRVDPYAIAEPAENNRAIRAFITPVFSAIAMDNHHPLVEAWNAIVGHPAYPGGASLVTAADVDDPTLKRMLELFDDLPDVPDDANRPVALDDPANLAALKAGWLRGEWADAGLWSPDDSAEQALRRRLVRAVRENYEAIIDLAGSRGR